MVRLIIGGHGTTVYVCSSSSRNSRIGWVMLMRSNMERGGQVRSRREKVAVAFVSLPLVRKYRRNEVV